MKQGSTNLDQEILKCYIISIQKKLMKKFFTFLALLSISSTMFAGVPQNAFAGIEVDDCSNSPSGIVIDNDIPLGTLGAFQVDVQDAGDTRCGVVTAEIADSSLITEDVIFDWFNYIEDDEGVFRLGDTTTSGPSLTGDDEVSSSGRYLGSNGNIIEWTAVSSIPTDAIVMDTVYTFGDAPCGTYPPDLSVNPLLFPKELEGPACESGVGFARHIQYLDEDVPPNVSNCVLIVRGTPAGGDLELLTIDTVEQYGISQGGAFTPAQGLVNANFDGWAASQFSLIVDELDFDDLVRPVSLTGEVDPSLPFFVHPVFGDSFGPEDVTSMMVWTMDANTQVTIPTTLGVIPSISDIPPIPSDPLVGGNIIPIDSISLVLVGAQSTTWMIPVVLSVLGIGLFVVSRKSENS